jgi:glycerol-3-phosphate dehydrogenase subunit B
MSELDLAPEVLVVGGGVAGFLAAARAREQGATVALVKKAGGGLPSSSGAIDVADDLNGMVPGASLDPFDRGGRWRKAADVVAAKMPRHPYAMLGSKRERLRESIALLKQLASNGGVDLVEREDGANHVVATQLGTVKRAALVQKTQHLDIGALDGDILVGVVEPMDLAGFNARSVTRMLSWIAGQSQRRVQFTPVVVERSLPGRELFASTFEMARHLDDDKARSAFADQLRAAMRKLARIPAHLLMPPVLGLDRSAIVALDLERAAGRPVRELLALPPSPPGERLQRALTSSVRKLGVAVVDGAATSAVTTSVANASRVSTVVIEGAGLRAEMKPKCVVLAGGRWFAGGLVRDGDAREPLLQLPVVDNGFVVGDSFIGDHLGHSPDGDHGIFRAGVAVDDALRPLDAAGRSAFDNVFCAGAIVAGWDPARDGTGAAVAALTGYVAGERAAQAR